MDAVRVENLVKVYHPAGREPVRAIDDVSLTVRRGEIFGFIGADGAGKTTAFKILAGVLEPTSGKVEVLGRRARDSRLEVGYLTQPFTLYEDLSIEENLRYSAGLCEVSDELYEQRSEQRLSEFGLINFRSRLAGRLSGGMKQKLALTCALISEPKLLLLDEPTTGVDPLSRREFWETLIELAHEGLSIIVATPYFDEAERANRVAFLESGKLLKLGSPREIRTELKATRFEVHAPGLRQAAQALRGADWALDVQRFGDRLDVLAPKGAAVEDRIREVVPDVESISAEEPVLENAFVARLHEMRGSEPEPPFPEPLAHRGEAEVALGAYGLVKRFGSFTAVNDVSIEIRQGEIYGLLGANGAGKTTAIKMICGLLAPTQGRVSLLGHTKRLRSAAIRSRIGYKSQKFSLYDDLSVGENLDFYAALYGVPPRLREARKRWALESSGLAGREEAVTAELPDGWKQRIAFCAAVMHEPEVVMLDEPTSGVDALARRAMWRRINELADRGDAVLVVTHYLDEAEQCNRLGFMADGELIAEGSPREIKSRMEGSLFEVRCKDPFAALRALRAPFGHVNVSLFGECLNVTAEDESGEAEIRALLDPTADVRPIAFGLENVFLRLVEERREMTPQP